MSSFSGQCNVQIVWMEKKVQKQIITDQKHKRAEKKHTTTTIRRFRKVKGQVTVLFCLGNELTVSQHLTLLMLQLQIMVAIVSLYVSVLYSSCGSTVDVIWDALRLFNSNFLNWTAYHSFQQAAFVVANRQNWETQMFPVIRLLRTPLKETPLQRFSKSRTEVWRYLFLPRSCWPQRRISCLDFFHFSIYFKQWLQISCQSQSASNKENCIKLSH